MLLHRDGERADVCVVACQLAMKLVSADMDQAYLGLSDMTMPKVDIQFTFE